MFKNQTTCWIIHYNDQRSDVWMPGSNALLTKLYLEEHKKNSSRPTKE